MILNRLYGYFTSTANTRNVAAHYNIAVPKEKTASEPCSLVSFNDRYFAAHELSRFNLETITYPLASMNPEPQPWDHDPNRPDFAETDKNREMKLCSRPRCQLYGHRGTTYHNPRPTATVTRFINFDSLENSRKFLTSPEEKMRRYEERQK
ncbi:hypothetical protein Hypma_010770 [Hypsizygus marmoreus]|uniref:Uncharacterized protein n=1 Tax=Hypsizygus marmoreus TaxID=39966 RepID=A0A369JQZ2_HYPMA|nr:hypothetical protein Hypma_010770 [Hypsizygus marmoreus]